MKQPKILENVTDFQEENSLREVLAFITPGDLEINLKQFKAKVLRVQKDTITLLSSDLWLKDNAHDLVNHVTLQLHLLLQTSV